MELEMDMEMEIKYTNVYMDIMKILYKFKIIVNKKIVMYSKHDNFTYAKTYKHNGNIVSDYISLEEYTSALASLILQTNLTNL